jgi:cytochrome P450
MHSPRHTNNIGQVHQEDWPRHRKVIAAPFNKNTDDRVWTTSLQQAKDMLKAWTSHNTPGGPCTAKDTRTLSLNVLASIGFNRGYKFIASSKTIPDQEKSYRGALAIVLDNALLMMLIPPTLLLLPLVPASWARIGRATEEFRNHMTDLLAEERRLLADGLPSSGNLISSLVRASEEEKERKNSSTDRAKGLQMSEILGNIFVINFAGHDTTANTLAYSILLLAANPEVQHWVREELQAVLPENTEHWNHHEHYSGLKRCLAVLVSQFHVSSIICMAGFNDCLPARNSPTLSTDTCYSKVHWITVTNAQSWHKNDKHWF